MLDYMLNKEAGYIRKWFIGILGEHCNENIDNDLDFCSIRCRDLDKHIAGTRGDFGMIAVDYWW